LGRLVLEHHGHTRRRVAHGISLLTDYGVDVEIHVPVGADGGVVDPAHGPLTLPMGTGRGALEREVDAHTGRGAADHARAHPALDGAERFKLGHVSGILLW